MHATLSVQRIANMIAAEEPELRRDLITALDDYLNHTDAEQMTILGHNRDHDDRGDGHHLVRLQHVSRLSAFLNALGG